MKNNHHQQNLKLKSSSFFKQTNDRYTQLLVCKEINVWCPTLNKIFIIPLQIYLYHRIKIIGSIKTLFLLKNYNFHIIATCLAPYTIIIACIYGSPI